MNVSAWRQHVAATANRGPTRLDDPDFQTRFLFGQHILDVRRTGQPEGLGPARTRATRVKLIDPNRDGKTLPFPDDSQDAVCSDRILQHITDYRCAIAEWFRVLRVGGFLVIAVPHQFLFERKLSLPSRFDTSHQRFYTAASLLLEIEEALDPLSYRVRFLEDNDSGFDYAKPPKRAPSGSCELVAVLEKLERPAYADAVLDETPPKTTTADRIPVLRTATAADGPTICMRSAPGDVQKLAVMKLDHRGDFIMAKPALLELHRRFPSAALTLICGSWNAADAEALGIFDEILTLDFFSETGAAPSSPQQRGQILGAFADLMRGRRFDLAIDLRVDPDTRPLLAEIDAAQRAGFGSPEQHSCLDIALPFVNPTMTRRWRTIGFDQFTSSIGKTDETGIVYAGRSYLALMPKRLLTGPRIALEAGVHIVELDILPTREPLMVGIDVCSAPRGTIPRTRFARWARPGSPPRFELYLGEAAEIEIGINSRPFGFVRPFHFKGCRLFKRGEWQGPHQQELMVMLASMVALRMANPYKIDELAR